MNDTHTNINIATDSKTSVQATDSRQTAVPFSFAQQWEFTLKELRETLRDRRTIVTLMVMPLLLYPMLGLGLRFLAFQESSDQKVEYRLAIGSEQEGAWLSEALQLGNRLIAASSEAKEQQPAPDVQLLVSNDPSEFELETLVKSSAADVGV